MGEYRITLVLEASDMTLAINRILYDSEGEPLDGLISISAEPA